MANSIFLFPGNYAVGSITTTGDVTVGGVILASNGTAAAPSYSFSSAPTIGWYTASNQIRGSIVGNLAYQFGAGGLQFSDAASSLLLGTNGDLVVTRDAANTLALRNAANAQAFRLYGYIVGSRSTYQGIQAVTTAVTLSGATTGTGNVIPAGATVVDVATTTTTTITNATGYTVGDGTDADRYGDITGTAVGTSSDGPDYTADPRWWATSARAITLTAKTANFTGGVVQVTVFYMTATAA